MVNHVKEFIFRFNASIYDYYACKRFKLHTSPPISKSELIIRSGFIDNNGFMAAYLYNVKTIMKEIATQDSISKVVDIGSGDGRLLSFVCRTNHNIDGVGIEIDRHLYDFSIDFNSRHNCKFFNSNALDFDFRFEQNTLIFIFHSFGEVNVSAIFRKIITQNVNSNVNIYVAYINDVHKSLLIDLGIQNIREWGHRKMSLWKV